ncbi:hypothetical protein Tco_0834611 [Tanacetum coccineum]
MSIGFSCNLGSRRVRAFNMTGPMCHPIDICVHFGGKLWVHRNIKLSLFIDVLFRVPRLSICQPYGMLLIQQKSDLEWIYRQCEIGDVLDMYLLYDDGDYDEGCYVNMNDVVADEDVDLAVDADSNDVSNSKIPMTSNKSFVSSPMFDDCDSYTSDETIQSKVTVTEVLAVKDDAFMVDKKYVNASALNLSSDENAIISDRDVLEKEVDDVPDVENVVSDGNKPLVMLESGKIAFNGSHAKSVDVVAVTIMSDSEHSTVTYTSLSEDDLYMGSPGVEVLIYEAPPSPDYVPGPEEPEQAPPSPIYVPFVPEPVYPEFLPVDDEIFPAEEQPLPAADSPTHQSPGYIPESDPEEDLEEDDEEDPEEDPADYPADRGDDDDEHLAPAEPAAVLAFSATGPYIAIAATARMSIEPQAPAPFLSEEVAERVLALLITLSPLFPYHPTSSFSISTIYLTNHISPTYVEGSLGSRAAGIRRRDALPSPIHDTEIPEMWLPLRKRLCRTTPSGYEVGVEFGSWTAPCGLELSTARQTYMDCGYIRGAPGRECLEKGVNQRVIELSSTVDEEDEIIYSQLDDARYDRALLRARVNTLESDSPFHRRTAVLMEEEARLSRAAWAQSMDACDQTHSEGILLRTTVMTQQSEIVELRAADQRRQTTAGTSMDPAEPEIPEEAVAVLDGL